MIRQLIITFLTFPANIKCFSFCRNFLKTGSAFLLFLLVEKFLGFAKNSVEEKIKL
jgi:hypothetical protein